MNQTTTRRAVLAGIAAAPALVAIPAFAATLPGVPTALEKSVRGLAADPIFALIKNHRRLNATYSTLSKALADLEGRLRPEDIYEYPRVPTFRQREGKASLIERSAEHVIIRHDEGPATGPMSYANSLTDLKTQAREIPKRDRAAWLADRRAALKAEQRRIQKVKDESGYTDLSDREQAAGNAEYDAGQELIATQPTTIAGTLALVAYAIEANRRDYGLMPDDEDKYILLETVVHALGAQVPAEIARSITSPVG